MDKMTLTPVVSAGTSALQQKKENDPASGFGQILKDSISSVNTTMQEAAKSSEGLIKGDHSNIHETMIALEKANVSFRLMTKVQGKVISAYQEVMRLQL